MKIKNESLDDIGSFLTETFPNFTAEMYRGNEPVGQGIHFPCDGTSLRWQTRFGGGETDKDGRVLLANFSLNHKITVYIVGSWLRIIDIRYAGKHDYWEYTNIPGGGVPSRSRHELEKEKIEEILNSEVEDCLFWRLVSATAKELYAANPL